MTEPVLIEVPSFELPDVLTPDDPEARDVYVKLNGKLIWNAYAASVREEWVDVRVNESGDPFDEQSPVVIVNGDYVNRRYTGVVTVHRALE